MNNENETKQKRKLEIFRIKSKEEAYKIKEGDFMKYYIISSDGAVRSTHRSYEAAYKRHQKDLAWRCGICGSTRGGWGKCAHNSRVCNAQHYGDKIVSAEK